MAEALQEQSDHLAISDQIPAEFREEFGLPGSAPAYIREAWLQPDSDHLKQLASLQKAVLCRQAEAVEGRKSPKSHMEADTGLQSFGILVRLCEHPRCPAGLATAEVQLGINELKKENVADEIMATLRAAQTAALKRFFEPLTAARLLHITADIAGKRKEPSASEMKAALEAVPGPLAALLKLLPDKYAKQKRASWRQDAALVFNLSLAAAKAFKEECVTPAVSTMPASEAEISNTASEASAGEELNAQLVELFGEE